MSTLLIGERAPGFKTEAVVNGKIVTEFSLDLFPKKYIIFFFYPLDFTFVCPTELHAFQEKLHEFEAHNTQVIGCSVDSVFCHLNWVNTSKTKGGIQGVTYPLVADLNKDISRRYHVLNEETGVAFRGLFLMDQKKIIRHQLVNDLPLGRSVSEAMRLLKALIFHEKHGEVCPANWEEGRKSMKPDQEGLISYFN